MDYIYEWIKEASYEQVKNCPFVTYIQKLIDYVVKDQRFKMDHVHKVCNPKKELSINDMKVQTTRPNFKRAKSYVPRQEDEGIASQVSLDTRLSQMSTKDLLAMLLQCQVAINGKIDRSMYLQKKLRTDYRQIKKAMNKLLVERGENVVGEEVEKEEEPQVAAKSMSDRGKEAELEGELEEPRVHELAQASQDEDDDATSSPNAEAEQEVVSEGDDKDESCSKSDASNSPPLAKSSS